MITFPFRFLLESEDGYFYGTNDEDFAKKMEDTGDWALVDLLTGKYTTYRGEKQIEELTVEDGTVSVSSLELPLDENGELEI